MNNLRLSFVIEAIDRATAVTEKVTAGVKSAVQGVAHVGREAFASLERVSKSYEGMAALVGGGFEIRDIVKESDYFARIKALSGASDEAIETLRHHMSDLAIEAKVSRSELLDAFKAVRSGGGSLDFFDEQLKAITASIALLGGHGEEIGDLLIALKQQFKLSTPEEFTSALAVMQAQLKGVDNGFDNFAARAAQLSSSYAQLGRTGLDAARELGAVYAVIAKGTGSPRQAASAVDGLIKSLQDAGQVTKLESYGVQIYANNEDRKNTRTLPLTDILTSIAQRYASNPYDMGQALGPELLANLKTILNEAKGGDIGKSLKDKLSVSGDPTEFFERASKASVGLAASLRALDNSLKKFGEENLTGAIQSLADAISALNGPITKVLVGFAGFALLGTVVGWIISAARNFWVMATAIGAVVGWLAPIALWLAVAAEWLGALVAFIPGATSLFSVLSAGFLAIGVAIEATPIGWLITGIAAIALAAYMIYEHWEPIKKFFSTIWDAMLLSLNVVLDAVKAKWTAFTGWIEDRLQALSRLVPSWMKGGSSASAPSPSAFQNGSAQTRVGGEIVIKFEDAPEGMRVSQASSSNPEVPIDVEMGWNMPYQP